MRKSRATARRGQDRAAHKIEGAGYAPNSTCLCSWLRAGIGAAADRAVMIDEPSAGQYYGGAVAAPCLSHVMTGALRMLAVSPDAPVDNIVLPPPEAPEIKEEV